jgi:hypothetical protein
MQPDPLVRPRRQCRGDEFRPQIGTADADHHHVGKGPPARAGDASGVHLGGEVADLPPHTGQLGLHVPTVQEDGGGGKVAAGGVQGGPFFGGVDLGPGQHAAEGVPDAGLLPQRMQQGHGVAVHPLAGKIVEQPPPREAEVRQAATVLEEVTQVVVRLRHDVRMDAQELPGGRLGGVVLGHKGPP